MNLSDLASIAGDISAIALVITLVFLNLQVRQSEKNQRALIQQGRASRTVDIAIHIMSSDFESRRSKLRMHYINAIGPENLTPPITEQILAAIELTILAAERREAATHLDEITTQDLLDIIWLEDAAGRAVERLNIAKVA